MVFFTGYDGNTHTEHLAGDVKSTGIAQAFNLQTAWNRNLGWLWPTMAIYDYHHWLAHVWEKIGNPCRWNWWYSQEGRGRKRAVSVLTMLTGGFITMCTVSFRTFRSINIIASHGNRAALSLRPRLRSIVVWSSYIRCQPHEHPKQKAISWLGMLGFWGYTILIYIILSSCRWHVCFQSVVWGCLRRMPQEIRFMLRSLLVKMYSNI